MGSLSVEISTDNGTNWNQLDASGNIVIDTPILTGQQQSNSTSSWLQQSINLNAYGGQFIKLRYRYNRINIYQRHGDRPA